MDSQQTWRNRSRGTRLIGATALVTGADGEVGTATARHLAALGGAVTLVASRREPLELLAEQISAEGGLAQVVVTADVRDRHQAEAVVEHCVGEWGRLDILIDNAGTFETGSNPAWSRYRFEAALPYLAQAAATGRRQIADLVIVGPARLDMVPGRNWPIEPDLLRELVGRGVRVTTVTTAHRTTSIGEGREDDRVPHAADAADAVGYAVTRPAHTTVSELVIRPTTR